MFAVDGHCPYNSTTTNNPRRLPACLSFTISTYNIGSIIYLQMSKPSTVINLAFPQQKSNSDRG